MNHSYPQLDLVQKSPPTIAGRSAPNPFGPLNMFVKVLYKQTTQVVVQVYKVQRTIPFGANRFRLRLFIALHIDTKRSTL